MSQDFNVVNMAEEYEEYEEFEEGEEGEEGDDNTEVVVSYACEDCDYRWEVTFEDEEEESLDATQYCPMCGSANSTQI